MRIEDAGNFAAEHLHKHSTELLLAAIGGGHGGVFWKCVVVESLFKKKLLQ